MTDPLDAAPLPSADAHGAPPPGLVRSPLSDGEWHRMHPLTPLLRGGLFLLVVIGVVVANLRDRLIVLFLPNFAPDAADGLDEYEEFERSGDPIDWIVANNLYLLAVLAVLVVLVVLIVLFTLSWRFHTFRITGDDVEVRSGVLFRTQRRAPLDRVQGVNLVRPMVARLLGLAKLEVVGAGADANVKLEYLATTNAEAVRADILRLASGRRLADAAAAGSPGTGAPRGRVAALSQTVSRGVTGLIEGDEAPVAEPESVVHIPLGRLVASHVVSMSTVVFVLMVAGVAVAASFGVSWVLFAYVPAIIGLGVFWVRSITRSLRYAIAPTPDGVRITFGLFTTTTEIVPPGRIHAVEIVQPVLWRGFGWWRIRINRLSGRSASESNADQFTTALPVGTRTDVERVLRLLKPEVPDAEWGLIIGEGLTGPGEADPFTTMPRRARILRPFSWRRTGFLLTPDLLLMRRGLIWRTLSLLPLARLQSFGAHQGPIDRMLGVASVRAHVVAGPVDVRLPALDRTSVLALLEDVAHASVRAAAVDRSHRWAQTGQVPVTDAPPTPSTGPRRDEDPA
ncbi:PH domain-containing protein [Microbacterium sp. BWT-B31]|uniref:PH domain-containing protein n=1 Tax=Microbacterium sp. BWT-B31 TaxID=3232072 RepID=UPI0035299147